MPSASPSTILAVGELGIAVVVELEQPERAEEEEVFVERRVGVLTIVIEP